MIEKKERGLQNIKTRPGSYQYSALLSNVVVVRRLRLHALPTNPRCDCVLLECAKNQLRPGPAPSW